jgi:hypothetical protein
MQSTEQADYAIVGLSIYMGDTGNTLDSLVRFSISRRAIEFDFSGTTVGQILKIGE